MRFEEAAGASLSQMEPGSPLLENLAASPDPGVEYHIVAGNTSLSPDALEPQGPELEALGDPQVQPPFVVARAAAPRLDELLAVGHLRVVRRRRTGGPAKGRLPGAVEGDGDV